MSQGVCRRLKMNLPEPDLTEWTAMGQRAKACADSVEIALVGKYIQLHDSYLSVVEALTHGGIENDVKVNIRWVDSEQLTDENAGEHLSGIDGILVPGGFGDRGVEGMISAVRYARENRIPFFGICLGMQMAVLEFARNVAGLTDAHSSEFSDTANPVIDLMPEQRDITEKGGTMRLGAYACKLIGENSFSRIAYGEPVIYERHRHRYEFNNLYREILSENGLLLAGLSPSEKLVEIVELPGHPWFVGAQFHPEFKSRPNRAHPLFRNFVGAAKKQHQR